MGRVKTVRNIAIVLAIAAAVYFIPGGGRVASAFEAALWAAFGVGFGFLAVRLYRERRVWIYSLGDRHRALLYVGVAAALFAWAARSRMWQTGLGELGWFMIVGFIVYAAMEVYRHSRTY
ncbi:MAG TPA: hypothetical protein VKG82_11710 [Solirubrobacteraceae bacterium]|nr:hypothetical protein [Solirubrobacteraceae bacterium]